MFKKRDNEHNWSEWDLRWDHKKGRVWTRRCLDRGCSFIEKSTYAPILIKREKGQETAQKHPDDVIKWFDAEMNKK